MSFLKENTKWVLFLASAAQAEKRHILDLAFGLWSLERVGVSPADIFIYIDGADRQMIDTWISQGSHNQYIVKSSADFFIDQKSNKHKNMMMFVTGHGSIEGLHGNPPIKPSALLGSLKTSPGLQRAVVYFGQCDAGVFNYMAVGSKRQNDGSYDPAVVFIGATNLHSSLSAETTEELASGPMPWTANVFLLFVFKWIQNQFDVDGDGKLTIMDSYKFAGAFTNTKNKSGKLSGFYTCLVSHENFVKANDAYQADQNNSNLKLACDAAEKIYINNLNIQLVHQECWILNSMPAQEWEI